MKHRIDANEFMELSCRVESLSRRLDCFSRSDMTVVMDLSERVKKLETLQKGYKNVMTSSEAAEYLGISRKKIYDLVRTKNLPFFKPTILETLQGLSRSVCEGPQSYGTG